MVSYRFVSISSQKGVLFFETPGIRFLYHGFLYCNFSFYSVLYIVSNVFKWRAPCKTTLLKGNPP